MKKIEKIEKLMSLYESWMPSDIAFVKSLEWSIHNMVVVFYCQLRNNYNSWPDMSEMFFELSVTFKNISRLKLDFIGGGLCQISGFDILDVSDSGLEKVNFQIEDYENGIISFGCEEIEINWVSDPDRSLYPVDRGPI